MSDIDIIRDEKRTEDDKMELLADYLETVDAHSTFDSVLDNGDTATNKAAKIEESAGSHNFSTMTATQVYTQKEYADGAAIAQLTSDGKLSLDYDPEQGNPSFFTIEMSNGTPKVLMSDDVKAAFKDALGI